MSLRRAGTGRTIGIVSTINDPQLPALQAAQAADSPTGHWLMQETGGTTMVDSSGNGYDGTYTSCTVGQAAIASNGTYSVSTSAGIASVPFGAWMNAASFTIEVLCYPTNTAPFLGIAGKFNTEYWTWSNDGIGAYVSTTAGAVNHTGGGGLSNNVAYLLGMRVSAGASVSFWKNGIRVVNDATAGDGYSHGTALKFLSSSGGYGYIGRQSFAAFYTTAVSDARMLAHAQAAGLA